jgi:hypothetical protein
VPLRNNSQYGKGQHFLTRPVVINFQGISCTKQLGYRKKMKIIAKTIGQDIYPCLALDMNPRAVSTTSQ